MIALYLFLIFSGSGLLVQKARILPQTLPGGPSYSRKALLNNNFAAKAKAL